MSTHDTTTEGPRFRWVVHQTSAFADAVASFTGRPARTRCGEVQAPAPDAPPKLIHLISCEHCHQVTPLPERIATAALSVKLRLQRLVTRLQERVPGALRGAVGAGLVLAASALAVGVLVGAGLLVVAVFGWIGDGLTAAGEFLGHHAADGLDRLLELPAVAMVTDPIGHWLAVHGHGLPVSTYGMAVAWAAGGLGLFLLATLRSRGARIGWPLYGTATAAMAWFGATTEVHRPIVAGAVGLAWCVASVLAYRRPGLRRW